MEIDADTAAAASFALASTTTADQASSAVPTILVKVKKEITLEQWAAESKKRAALRQASRQRAKEQKVTKGRAK
jgi:hypothetical protein